MLNDRYMQARSYLHTYNNCLCVPQVAAVVLNDRYVQAWPYLHTYNNYLCVPQVAAVVLSDRYVQARPYLHTYNNYLLPIVWYMAPWVIVAVVNVLLALQVT